MSDTETRFGLEVIELPGNVYIGRILRIIGEYYRPLFTSQEFDEEHIARLACKKKAVEKFWTPLRDMTEVGDA